MNESKLSIMDTTHFLDLPIAWRPANGRTFDFTEFRGIYVAKYKYEERRMLIFSGIRGNLGITVNVSEIRPLAKGLLLHLNSSQAVKIEEGGKIYVPERPE